MEILSFKAMKNNGDTLCAKQWHQRFHASPRAEVYGVVNARIADTIDKFFSIGCVMTTNTKDVPFFVSHKRYHIHWPTPKTGYYFCSSGNLLL
jgi:hypothetical protein